MAYTNKQIQQAMKVAAMMLGGAPAVGGAAGGMLGKKVGRAVQGVGQNIMQQVQPNQRTAPVMPRAQTGQVPRSMETPPPRPDVLMRKKMVEGAAKRKMTGY